MLSNASLLHRLGTTHRLPQSRLMPTAVTTGSHLARSPFTNAVNSSGVDGDGTASCISNCFFNSAECSVLIAALRSLSSTSTASPAGAIKPYQLSESTVLKPASPVVGTSGKAARRRRHCKRLDRTGANVRQQHRDVEHDHIDVTTEQVIHRRRCAAEGHVNKIDVGLDLEQLYRQMREGSGAG